MVFSIAVCGGILWLYYKQRETIERTERVLTSLRQARIDLGNGFLHLTLAGDQRSPFRREEGVALLEQSIAVLQQAEVRELAHEAVLPVVGASHPDLQRIVADFRRLLDDWRGSTGNARPDLELQLRIVFHDLDHLAQRMDLASQQELRALTRLTNRRFTFTVASAIVLLGFICAYVYVTRRNESAAARALRNSEERLRVMGDNLPDAYIFRYRNDQEGQRRFAYVSAGVARVHGISAEEVLRDAQSILAQIDPGQRPAFDAAEEQSARSLNDFHMDVRIRRANGEERTLRVRSRPNQDTAGVVQWDGVVTDITERTRMEAALQEKAALLREMSEMAHIGGWDFDPATGEGAWTEEVARIHDMDPASPTTRDIGLNVYHGPWRTKVEAALQGAIERGEPYDLELEMVTTAGNRKWVRTQGRPVLQDGRVVRLRGSIQEITDRKRIELTLREEKDRLAKIAAVAPSAIHSFRQGSDGRIFFPYASPRIRDFFGVGPEELTHDASVINTLWHPDDLGRVIASTEQSRRTMTPWVGEFRVRHPTKGVQWIDGRSMPVNESDGSVTWHGVFTDITERKRAELYTEVQHSVTAVLSGATSLLATAHRILEVICRRLDWDLGDLWAVDRTTKTLRCVEVWHPPSTEYRAFADASRMMAFAAGEGLPGSVWSAKEPQWIPDVTRDGKFRRKSEAAGLGLRGALAFPLQMRGEVLGVMEFFSLHTRQPDSEMLSMFAAVGAQIGQFIERKRLEDQFHQAQKMEALGTLAGGIAHDFNNVLAAIAGYTELAKMQSADNPEAMEYLQAVSVASTRAVDLVRQILAFSRLQEPQRKPIQLWPIIDEALRLLRATIPSTIEFEVSLVRRGPPVLADSTQIHQVVMNLATNASHAMRDRPGRLSVTLESIIVDADLAARHTGLRAGAYLLLSVGDTGHGMDEETLGRIFEPFFTTKGPGEGTGLGLAVVHGIVQNHDGVITVYSQRGQGTRFQIYLPAHLSEMAELVVPLVEPPRGHGERILVVDDEMPLALMGKKFLERLGYLVDAHSAPAKALESMRAGAQKYDLVVTDLTMPGMPGTELAKELLRTWPDMPIILTTGHSASLTRERVRAMGIQEILLKPLTIHGLGEAVHRVLMENKPHLP